MRLDHLLSKGQLTCVAFGSGGSEAAMLGASVSGVVLVGGTLTSRPRFLRVHLVRLFGVGTVDGWGVGSRHAVGS